MKCNFFKKYLTHLLKLSTFWWIQWWGTCLTETQDATWSLSERLWEAWQSSSSIIAGEHRSLVASPWGLHKAESMTSSFVYFTSNLSSQKRNCVSSGGPAFKSLSCSCITALIPDLGRFPPAGQPAPYTTTTSQCLEPMSGGHWATARLWESMRPATREATARVPASGRD